MTFFEFSQTLQQLEQTASRLEMTEQLARLYNRFEQNEIEKATYMMQGRLVPEYQSLEFNLSTKMIQRALTRLLISHQEDQTDTPALTQTNLFGEEDKSQFDTLVSQLFKDKGDLGIVAQDIVHKIQQVSLQKRASITNASITNASTDNASSILETPVGDEEKSNLSDQDLLKVFAQLEKIAQLEGSGSQDKKVLALMALLESVEPLSARYITRIIMGKLRLGFSTMTLIDALSWAVYGDKSARDKLEEAYNKQANVGTLAQRFLSLTSEKKREQLLATYTVENGVPVVPELAQRLNSASEIIAKMGEVFVEPKYDGLRVQIHFSRNKRGSADKKLTDNRIKITAYTRNLEDISQMLPELLQAESAFSCDSCILDSEAIGYDPHSNQLVSFQQTVTRKRKHGVTKQAEEIPLRFYIFDVMELNGESLIDLPLAERKKKLSQVFESTETFYQTEYLRTDQATEITAYHRKQLEAGLEGALMKQVDAPYRGGRKGWRWVKMKEAEGTRGKLIDTVDCIVLGYYVGKGKRSAFGIGAILVGVRDADQDEIKTVTKIGTGLTDDQFREMKQRCDAVAVENKPSQYDVDKDLYPDVWVDPKIVIEVAADEVTHSPKHTAGIALRFPRLITFRDDKDWEDATSLDELKAIKNQSS